MRRDMLKRAFVLLSGTVTGLVGVLSYNPPHLAGAMSTPIIALDTNSLPDQQPADDTATSNTINGTPSQSRTAANTPKASDNVNTTQEKSPKTSSQPRSTPMQQQSDVVGTYRGDVVSTKYGPVQVQINVTNGQITSAEVLAYPSRDRRSLQISQAVLPWLVQETVRIQSASVMAVSGATITTNAWNNSLASALQKAGK